MKRFFVRSSVNLVVLSLVACSGNVSVRGGNAVSTSAVPPGTSVQSGSAGLQANVGSGSGALFGLVIVGIMTADAVNYFRGTGRWMREPPPPAEDRKINVQDCTRPVDPSQGNLKCR